MLVLGLARGSGSGCKEVQAIEVQPQNYFAYFTAVAHMFIACSCFTCVLLPTICTAHCFCTTLHICLYTTSATMTDVFLPTILVDLSLLDGVSVRLYIGGDCPGNILPSK